MPAGGAFKGQDLRYAHPTPLSDECLQPFTAYQCRTEQKRNGARQIALRMHQTPHENKQFTEKAKFPHFISVSELEGCVLPFLAVRRGPFSTRATHLS